MKPVIVVHGGAGAYRKGIERVKEDIKREIRNSINEGLKALHSGSALDGVEKAITYMESCGRFNAGKGAVLNILGETELDASIMDGNKKNFGSVGALKGYWNAIRVARGVMELTDHVFLVGEGASKIAKKIGLEVFNGPLERRIREFKEYKKEYMNGKFNFWRKNKKLIGIFEHDTVGAIALDSSGRLAAGVSTGGIWLKLSGRVGDSSLVGAGFYASSKAACAATGIGETIARALLCRKAVEYVEYGLEAQEASNKAINDISKEFGNGVAGIILVDYKGNIGLSFNTDLLIAGYEKDGKIETNVYFKSQNKL